MACGIQPACQRLSILWQNLINEPRASYNFVRLASCQCRKKMKSQFPLKCSNMWSMINEEYYQWGGLMIQTVVDHHFPSCLAQHLILTCFMAFLGNYRSCRVLWLSHAWHFSSSCCKSCHFRMLITSHMRMSNAGRWQKVLIHWPIWKGLRPKRRGFLLCQKTASLFYQHMCIPALASAMIMKLLQAASVSFQSCKNVLTLRHIMLSIYGQQNCHKYLGRWYRPLLGK